MLWHIVKGTFEIHLARMSPDDVLADSQDLVEEYLEESVPMVFSPLDSVIFDAVSVIAMEDDENDIVEDHELDEQEEVLKPDLDLTSLSLFDEYDDDVQIPGGFSSSYVDACQAYAESLGDIDILPSEMAELIVPVARNKPMKA